MVLIRLRLALEPGRAFGQRQPGYGGGQVAQGGDGLGEPSVTVSDELGFEDRSSAGHASPAWFAASRSGSPPDRERRKRDYDLVFSTIDDRLSTVFSLKYAYHASISSTLTQTCTHLSCCQSFIPWPRHQPQVRVRRDPHVSWRGRPVSMASGQPTRPGRRQRPGQVAIVETGDGQTFGAVGLVGKWCLTTCCLRAAPRSPSRFISSARCPASR